MDVDLLVAAFSIAARVHDGQVRKGSDVPYLSHLLAVTQLVMTYGGDDVESAAALLHDAVEDGGGAAVLGQIEAACGPRVAAIVRACSDSFVDTTAGGLKAEWVDRKRTYISHLSEGDVAPGAVLVSACDKLHNLVSTRADYDVVGSELWSRFKTGWSGQVWYYRSLLEVYRSSDDRRARLVADQLERELSGLEDSLRRDGYPVSGSSP